MMAGDERLWDAKVQVMAGLAAGSLMTLPGDDERAGLFFEMMGLVEAEHDDHFKAPAKVERQAAPAPRARQASTSTSLRVDWPTLIESARHEPSKTVSVHYKSHLTAGATVSKVRERYASRFPGLEVWSGKDDIGDGGTVFVRVA